MLLMAYYVSHIYLRSRRFSMLGHVSNIISMMLMAHTHSPICIHLYISQFVINLCMIIGWISANGICSSEIPAMAQPVNKCLADVRQLEPNGIEIAKEIYFSHLTFFPIFWQTPVFSYTDILPYRRHNSYLIASVQVNLLNQAPSYWWCFVSVYFTVAISTHIPLE